MILPLLGALAALSLQTPVAAPTPAGPDEAQRVAGAAALGRLLYGYDRAAWVSSDALTAAIPKDQLGAIGGYVVEPATDGVLRVTYYRGQGAEARAFFVADVRGGKVIRGDVLATPTPLTPAQASLARAREIAALTARDRAFRPCTPLPFNTVAVPLGRDGPIAVYLLSAQQEANAVPFGGAYRVVVAPDGRVLATRPYATSCRSLTPPKLRGGETPVGFVLNHLLDPVPTELHVFAAYSLGMPLYVATPDKRLWKVSDGTIVPTKAP